MTIFKENKDNLLPCSLKTEKVGLQRSYTVWASAIDYGTKCQRINQKTCDEKPIMEGTISGTVAM